MDPQLEPGQVNLVVWDIGRSLAFYRLLGWDIGPAAGLHASITFPNGFSVDLDQYEFAVQWNSGTPDLAAGSVVLCLYASSRDDVDSTWQRLVGAGQDRKSTV